MNSQRRKIKTWPQTAPNIPNIEAKNECELKGMHSGWQYLSFHFFCSGVLSIQLICPRCKCTWEQRYLSYRDEEARKVLNDPEIKRIVEKYRTKPPKKRGSTGAVGGGRNK